MTNIPPSAFVFETEFTPDGGVVGGPAPKFLARTDAERMAATARNEGEAQALMTGEARAFAAIDRMVAHIAPVQRTLTALATELRREASELALVAARRIAGQALDANGATVAAEAVTQAVRLLKASPIVTIAAPPESMPVIERRMEQLRKQGQAAGVVFAADETAQPGDWRVEWSDGSSAFSREQVEAAISAILDARLEDPVEPQLELFSAA